MDRFLLRFPVQLLVASGFVALILSVLSWIFSVPGAEGKASRLLKIVLSVQIILSVLHIFERK